MGISGKLGLFVCVITISNYLYAGQEIIVSISFKLDAMKIGVHW